MHGGCSAASGGARHGALGGRAARQRGDHGAAAAVRHGSAATTPRLYELGARRVVVTGTGPLGCVPAELALHSRGGECATELMRAVDLYNPQLVGMVRGLNRDVGADVFVTANTYRANFDYITNPQSYGFRNVQVACCGQGPYNGIGLCTAASSVCADRDVFAFWDPFHPTERANRIIVGQFMYGSTDYMHPMNLSTILAMDGEGL